MSVCYKCGLKTDDCRCVIDLTPWPRRSRKAELAAIYHGIEDIQREMAISDRRVAQLQIAREIVADLIMQEVE